MELTDKKVVVIGAGISGIGACKLLTQVGARVTLYDGKKVTGELPEDIKVIEGDFPYDILQETDLAVISPGVPTDLDFVKEIVSRRIPLWGELELAYNYDKGQVLAITGTNGKTTTTSLLGHIMKHWKDQVFVVGNIGTPYTQATLQTSEDSVTVAEVSSFQLETIHSFHPGVSAILNITPDHLNRHHTMECYIDVKESITLNQGEYDTCVLNYEDQVLREFGEKLIKLGRTGVLFFSSSRALEHGLYLEGESIVYDDGILAETVCDVKDLNLIGIHNYENVMAAVGMALMADVPLDIIRIALPTFYAVPHRMEFSGEVNGVVYYNDSKGTNPDAAIKAIKAMDRPTYLIGGGYDKDADYTEWIKAFDGKVKKLVCIGATKEKIKACAEKLGFQDVLLMDTFEEAFQYCANHAVRGEGVLLSPACASWGMFENYEKRGDRFKELVKKL